VLLIDRILLIHIDLEELVMALTLEVLVPDVDVRAPATRHAGRFTYEFNFWKLA
jgi:hypothetical protein